VEQCLNIPSLHADRYTIKIHLRAHFKHTEEQQMYCPTSLNGGTTTPLCRASHPMTKEEAWIHIHEAHHGIPEYMALGETKNNNPSSDTENSSAKPPLRKISKFAKAQQPRDEIGGAYSGSTLLMIPVIDPALR
jgi:hypothetical protein